MGAGRTAEDRPRIPEGARLGQRTKSPRSGRKDATRECILDAATHLLVERGYASLRVAAVAEAAGVSLGGQLHHFPTKDSLVLGVLERLSAKVMQFVRREAAAASGDADPLMRMSTSAERFYVEPEFLIYLDIFLSVRRHVLLGETAVKLLHTNRKAIEGIWTPQLHALGIDGKQAHLIVRSIWGLSRGLAISSVGDEGRADNRATISFVIDALRADSCGHASG